MDKMPINEIIIDNPYLRLNTDVSELEKSIKAIGPIAPLIVDEDKHLLAGGRRYQALKNLGYDEVPIIQKSVNEFQKELISIDENLVRKDLSKIEMEANLCRGKDLYTALLNQNIEEQKEVKKEMDESSEELELKIEENENSSEVEILASQKFIKDISEKTGMGPQQIYQAIRRDEKSSTGVKEARGNGDLSISQTNEIIKLSSSEQEQILPLIKDKTVAEVRKLIKTAKSKGIEEAIEEGLNEVPHAREFKQLLQTSKRMRKLLTSLEVENITLSGDFSYTVAQEWELLSDAMNSLLPEESSQRSSGEDTTSLQ
jgi:ParB family transcriptional regulator, chromosome partitioning protein